MFHRVAFCLLLSTALILTIGRGSVPAADDQTVSNRNLQWQGVASCASMACHHGNQDKGVQGSEYTIWINHDAHARAYLVLFNKQSEQINACVDGGRFASAADNPRCLACHASQAPQGQRGERFRLEDGVGCESCHGPAEKWLGEHYRWPRDMPASAKEALGMRNTKDLVVRTKLCLDCHVGRGDGNVDHDLIAAGHPRLNFENGLFQARMPRHWDEAAQKKTAPDLEVRTWAIGQALAAQAALELLAHRAQDGAAGRKPWPELAEYDCFACHHDLSDSKERQVRKGTLGLMQWAPWYHAETPALAGELALTDPARLRTSLQELHRLMGAPHANAREVADRAGKLATEYGSWLNRMPKQVEETRARRLLAAAARRDLDQATATWDDAAQRYLCLAALTHGLSDLNPARRQVELKQALDGLGRLLSFPDGFTSPVRFDRDRKDIRERLSNIQNLVGP